jgi:putative ABC transport system substrate-binding protein
LTVLNPEISAKRLELLKESLPRISRVAVLTNPGNPIHTIFWRETRTAAQTLGLHLQPIKVRAPEDFDEAFRAATSGRAAALLAFDDPLTVGYRARLVALAAKYRLPTMYGLREFPDAGGLVSYGPNFPDQYRRTASYVDRILKGARPADLPVEQPTKFELVIIDMCRSNRHYGHKKAGSSEAAIKERRSAGRLRAFLVIRHNAAMSASTLSGRPLASVALK